MSSNGHEGESTSVSFSHDHVGFSVTAEDLDATIDWYSNKFGLTIDKRFESHDITFVFLVRGDVKIELMAGASTRQTPTDDVLTSMNPSRIHHFCLAVANLDATISELGAQGVQLIGGPMQVADIGQRIAFITDNLGNIIELAEPGTWPTGRQN